MVSQKVAGSLFLSFRRKPESRFIGQFQNSWTPASAGVTTFGAFAKNKDFEQVNRSGWPVTNFMEGQAGCLTYYNTLKSE
jgi:hypothetical protein